MKRLYLFLIILFWGFAHAAESKIDINDYKTWSSLLLYMKKSAEKGTNDILITYKKESFHINFSFGEWGYSYPTNEKEHSFLSNNNKFHVFKMYLFHSGIKFEDNIYNKNKLKELGNKIKKESKGKICFLLKIDEKLKEEKPSDFWKYIHFLHKTSENRVAYVSFK